MYKGYISTMIKTTRSINNYYLCIIDIIILTINVFENFKNYLDYMIYVLEKKF